MSLQLPSSASGWSRGLIVLSMLAAIAALLSSAAGQPAPRNGPRDIDPRWHALVGATVVTRPGERIENATVVVRDGVIVSVAAGAPAPAGARVWDYAGLIIYPGLIDACVFVDAPAPDAKAPGAHWNARVTPQRSALDGPGIDDKTRKTLRDMGFVAAGVAPKGGVFRGVGAVVSLGDTPAEHEAGAEAFVSRAFHALAFELGEGYPASEMGAIALIRQTLSDADWRAEDLRGFAAAPTARERPMPADALDALRSREDRTPLLFDCEDELQVLRAATIGREFGRPVIALGSGNEYKRLAAVSKAGVAVITPLRFPEAPKVDSPGDQESVDLRELMAWEQAPTNARRLDAAGIPVALTTERLRNRADFRKNLREAIRHGLTEDRALAALTTTPARVLGLEGRLGAVAPGHVASFVVVEGASLFDAKAKVRDVWVDGGRHRVTTPPGAKVEGEWAVRIGEPLNFDAVFEIADGPKVKVKAVGNEGPAKNVRLVENRLSMVMDNKPWGEEGAWSFVGVVEGETMLGTGVSHDGARFSWSATRTGDVKKPERARPEAPAAPDADKPADANQPAPPPEAADKPEQDKPAEPAKDGENAEKDEKPEDKPDVPEELGLPFGPWSRAAMPPMEDLLITGATVWTNGPDGIIENGAVLIRNGKIAAVGRSIPAPGGVPTIDAAGRHLTPGIIDCHSHTGISRGVNEGTQSVTTEVRIFDVINPDDVSWYRQLAAGVTAVNQLHGSANAMGGQNSVVKNRWGAEAPNDMRFEGAASGIKFALGENVKQSNWGDRNTTRYPQTRMGVETIIRDGFIAARDYAAARERWARAGESERRGMAPFRRDLELEALAEILAGERLIHCHSYRQDEILMLTRVARDFGFIIGTFQHVLEGYKVAEAIKEHAIGASAFSDWWAFKVEVQDAIPEAGAIMHEVGVNVSFNSDSDELARRMNGEAAKAVKYGGVNRVDALKFVTLNAAKQLKIDRFTGSIEPGKDADLALWSGDPLSSLSRCEMTFVDGRRLFSLEDDRAMRERDAKERRRIINKILARKPEAGGGGGAGPRPQGGPTSPVPGWTAESLRALERRNLDLIRAGEDPSGHRCGECGVTYDAHDH